jgi:hypothetical protein
VQAIAAAEQQAHGCVAGVAIMAKCKGDTRCSAPPVFLLWNGIKMKIVQPFDLDRVDSIPAIPLTQITCFVVHFNILE